MIAKTPLSGILPLPAPAIAFEAAALAFIWWASVGLALGTVLIALALLTRRAISDRRASRTESVAQALRKQLLATQQPLLIPDLSVFPELPPEQHPVAVNVGLDLLRTLRGGRADRMVTLLTRWGVENYLLKTSEQGGRGERIRALTLLSFFESEDSLLALLEQTDSQSTYVRLAALRGLARRNASADLMAICRHLGNDTNTRMLADILARFPSGTAPDICKLASGASADEVRLAAVIALGAIGALEGTDTLMDLAREDENEDIRAQSIEALAKIGDRRAEAPVMAALQDLSPGVRARAASAAGKMRIISAIPYLNAQLADDDWWARFRAAESLLKFGDRGVALLRSVAAKNGRAATIAGEVLMEQGHAL